MGVNVAVMGAGSWGTAFANTCLAAGSEVMLWARRPEVAHEINTSQTNETYLTGVVLHEGLRATSDPAEAMEGAQIVVLAVPSHALAGSLAAWASLIDPSRIAVSLIKGLTPDAQAWGSQVIAQAWPITDANIVVISGPNLARECAQGMPSATVVAGPDARVCALVQSACHIPSFRVYTNDDRMGVEVGGAVKNAIAIAAGIADGLGYGANTKAMLLTRGLAEMTRLGLALGGQAQTFAGLAGMGDLVATCMSPQSRNRGVGEAIGRGKSLAEITGSMNMVAEGVKSSKAMLSIANSLGVEVPLIEHVVAVVHGGMDPVAMAERLMGRSPKAEFHGFKEARG